MFFELGTSFPVKGFKKKFHKISRFVYFKIKLKVTLCYDLLLQNAKF